MRIWIGKEEEGNDNGLLTLFIEARIIGRRRAEKIARICRQYSPCFLYLGANKKNLIYISQSAREILSFIRLKLETSNSVCLGAKEIDFFQVILRYERKNIDNIILKLENPYKVKVFSFYKENTKEGLVKGLYPNDKLLLKI